MPNVSSITLVSIAVCLQLSVSEMCGLWMNQLAVRDTQNISDQWTDYRSFVDEKLLMQTKNIAFIFTDQIQPQPSECSIVLADRHTDLKKD